MNVELLLSHSGNGKKPSPLGEEFSLEKDKSKGSRIKVKHLSAVAFTIVLVPPAVA
jgi:hypothetical protein